ncbi:MAG TPA: hypothetical protein VFQ53_24785 [Kofleriaceae bacterium]|nr:hypothetical protein [Kofleriaceae bacterium]
MYREDILMRWIRQFAEALARLAGLRKSGDLRAARDEIERLYEELGIPRELVDLVDAATLAGMLRTPDRMRAAARLLWEEGHVLRATGDPLAAGIRYRRAHELFLEARAIAPEPDDDAAILELSRVAPGWELAERYRATRGSTSG